MVKFISSLVLVAGFLRPTLAVQTPVPKQPAPQRVPKPKPERPEPPPKPARKLPAYVQNADATIERLRKTFHLTPEQVFMLRPLVDERNRNIIQVLESDEGAVLQRSDSQAVQDRFLSDFRSLLTPEQIVRLDKEVAARPGTLH